MLDLILLFAQSDGNLMVNATTDAGQEVAKSSGGGFSMIIMMLLIFVVFYFFMIRPQTKKQKELQKQRDALKKGDKIVTAGGIFGEIKEVQENSFIITVSKDVTLKVSKESVYVDATDAAMAANEAKK